VAAWFTLLEPAKFEVATLRRPDDPRLGEIIERWGGTLEALRPGRAVIVGFPQDEGVRRNGGRVGAAKAPEAIRRFLHRLTPFNGERDVNLRDNPPLDAGNVRVTGSLEQSQEALGEVVAGILKSKAVPVVIGGGHGTAYGHYLGYARANIAVGIINIDAHLDLRPCLSGLGHSGSPFRQALEHPTWSKSGSRYCCIGAQPFAVALDHYRYAQGHGCSVRWASDENHATAIALFEESQTLIEAGCRIMLTIDADAFAVADVPGVSAPNPVGLPAREAALIAGFAGSKDAFSSMELVEINPLFDVDDRSVRWAASIIWHFLAGLAQRAKITPS